MKIFLSKIHSQLIKSQLDTIIRQDQLQDKNLAFVESFENLSRNIKQSLQVIEDLLDTAELKLQIRTEIPKILNKFPFVLNHYIENFFLKAYNSIFKEQRTINFLIIEVARESLETNHCLIRILEKQQKVIEQQESLLQEYLPNQIKYQITDALEKKQH